MASIRAKAVLAVGLLALAVAGFGVLTLGFGYGPWTAGVTIAGIAAVGAVEVLTDTSSF